MQFYSDRATSAWDGIAVEYVKDAGHKLVCPRRAIVEQEAVEDLRIRAQLAPTCGAALKAARDISYKLGSRAVHLKLSPSLCAVISFLMSGGKLLNSASCILISASTVALPVRSASAIALACAE